MNLRHNWLATALILAMVLATALPAAQAASVDTEAGSGDGDLGLNYYRDVARRYPERVGFYCWVGHELYKSGDFKAAKEIFDSCAQRNHAQSMIYLSQMYMDGSGVKKDLTVSTKWMKRAAEVGYSAGQYNYGLSLLRGEGVPRDPKAGKTWIARAAAQGDSDARALIASNFDLSVVAAGLQR